MRAGSGISSLPPALLPEGSLPVKDLGIMTPTSKMEEVTFSKLGNQLVIVVREHLLQNVAEAAISVTSKS